MDDEETDSTSSLSGECKTVTVLFADVKGSVELLGEVEPEEVRALTDPALRRMTSCVRRYEGHVAETQGDGIVALFGTPVAHEDHPQRALYAALAMLEEIRGYARTLRLERGVSLELRVGVHTGEVMMYGATKDEQGSDGGPMGDTVSLGAKVRALAAPGSVVVSEAVRGLCEGRFRFRSLGPTRLKGVSWPIELYEVVGVGQMRTRLEAAERRGLTRFVGREEELTELRRALEVASTGRGQIVTVTGEAGVGKSRLLYEFRRSIPEGTLLLEAFGTPHENSSPYLAIVELLESHLRITPRDEESERREKLTARLLALDRSLEATLPYVFPLLDISDPSTAPLAQMDAEIRRQRTHAALRQVLLSETVSQPIVMLVEDLHWLDAESEAVVEELAEGLGAARALLVATSRPGHDERRLMRTYTTRLRLDPLPRAAADELLAALLGTDPLLEPLKRRVAERAEGNPFFLEEIVRDLFEKGVLKREGGLAITRPVESLRLPPTVEGVLAARIDRLAAEGKELLQIGAVLGRTFTLSLAAAVTNRLDEELRERLVELQRVELLYERPAFPEPEYIFKHALTREVAYDSVPEANRKLLHERAGRAIEARFAGTLAERYAELAHHYGRSVMLEKAIEYSQLAGDAASRRSANADAVAHLSAAIEMVAKLPESAERDAREFDLQIGLAAPLVAIRGYAAPEVEAAYVRAASLARRMDSIPGLFAALRGTWESAIVRGEFENARGFADELLELSRRARDSTFELHARFALGHTLAFLPELASAREQFERGISLYDRRRHGADAFLYVNDPGVACLCRAAHVRWCLGHPDEAQRDSQGAITLARQLAHAFNLAVAFGASAMLQQMRGDPQPALEFAEASIATAERGGFPFWTATGTLLRGWARVRLRPDEHREIAVMREAVADFQRSSTALVPYFLAVVADAGLAAGLVEDALEAVGEGIDVSERTGERWWQAELCRLKGELMIMRGRALEYEIEECLGRALDTAASQGAKSLELRAATSLGRFLAGRGDRGDARELVTPVYAWFSEGFDTADLSDARSLLDELHRRSAVRTSALPGSARAEPTFVFGREGYFWTIGRQGKKVIRLKDRKGLRFIAHLLRNPGIEFPPLELSAVGGESPSDEAFGVGSPGPREIAETGLRAGNLGDAGEILDARAKTAYRERLVDLRAELDEARANNDRGRVERLGEEIDMLTNELAAAVGLGGRDRRAASSAERARVAVTKAIRTAIAAIHKEDAELGGHLQRSVRTGTMFSYQPGAS